MRAVPACVRACVQAARTKKPPRLRSDSVSGARFYGLSGRFGVKSAERANAAAAVCGTTRDEIMDRDVLQRKHTQSRKLLFYYGVSRPDACETTMELQRQMLRTVTFTALFVRGVYVQSAD